MQQEAVLALLAKEPAHAYQLRARLDDALGQLGEPRCRNLQLSEQSSLKSRAPRLTVPTVSSTPSLLLGRSGCPSGCRN